MCSCICMCVSSQKLFLTGLLGLPLTSSCYYFKATADVSITCLWLPLFRTWTVWSTSHTQRTRTIHLDDQMRWCNTYSYLLMNLSDSFVSTATGIGMVTVLIYFSLWHTRVSHTKVTVKVAIILHTCSYSMLYTHMIMVPGKNLIVIRWTASHLTEPVYFMSSK